MKFIILLCAKLSVASALVLPVSLPSDNSPLTKDADSCPCETQDLIDPRQTFIALPTATIQTEYWYENINHNGLSPFIPDSASWNVFRNVVTDFGALGDGIHDDWEAIQNAIDEGNSFANRTSNSLGTTGQPATVYIPCGTYLLSRPLQLYVGTVVLGNPIRRPTLKAANGFAGSTIIFGKDPSQDATTNFYIGFKNIILDSTSVAPNTSLLLMDWSVSQATQLTNVEFNMPTFSTGHIGIAMPEGGSGTIMNDLTFNGGAVGIKFSNQQYMIKSVVFKSCTIGILVKACFDCVFQDLSFFFVGTAIDMTSTQSIGSIIVLDSTASNTGTFINTTSQTNGSHSLVIENFFAGGSLTSTVTASGKSILTGSVAQTWVYGNSYTVLGSEGSHQTGTIYPSSRSPALTDPTGKYRLFEPPTYDGHALTDFVNVKSVPGFPVAGDGVTDDTASLNSIAAMYAGCKILFFPTGTYIVSDTVTFPEGSRVIGEVWSAISATGRNFVDQADPTVMVRVGAPGDVGIAQFSDLLFTVADVLPGCTLLEVNIAGARAGDVGFWNTHFRVGGAAGSLVQTRCGGIPARCKAAFMLAHLTATSSVYIENMWGWTADHDLDGGNAAVVSTGRGLLIESTLATWLVGTAFEHHTLYQYNLASAAHVFIGMQQSETPYWQGNGTPAAAPAPWTASLVPSDPTFAECPAAPGGDECRMAFFQIIDDCSDVYIYGSGFWTFFNGRLDADRPGVTCAGNCQDTAASVGGGTEALHWYGINTRFSSDMIVDSDDDVVAVVPQLENPGGWGGVVAAYLADVEDDSA